MTKDMINTCTIVQRYTKTQILELFTKYSNTYIINIFNINENNQRVRYLKGIVNIFKKNLTILFTTQKKKAKTTKVTSSLY